MKKAMIEYSQRGCFDELYTPSYAVKPILNYIPRDIKKIWCPFDTEDSNYVKILKEAGYEVHASHKDTGDNFFESDFDDYDMIISNPPFSLKDDILSRCFVLGKPFALLLPITALEGKKRSKLFSQHGISVIVLDKRIDFNGKKSCWFNTSYFLWHPFYQNRLFFEVVNEDNEK